MGSPQAAAGFLLFSTTPEREVFDSTSLQGLYDVRAAPGRVTCLFPVAKRVQNRNGTLHGGCIATLVDVVGSAALCTQSVRGGVSLNISTNYLRPMPGGGVALIDSRVLSIGKNIATIEVDVIDSATGRLAARGVHVKWITENDRDLSVLAGLLEGPPPLPDTASVQPRLQSKL